MRWLLSLAVLLTAAVDSGSETMEMTTFYPAPTGNYNRLAADNVVLRPQAAAPASPKEGMMYVREDTSVPAENVLYMYNNGAWRRVLMAGGKQLAYQVSTADVTLTGSWQKVDGLKITFTTSKRGLYYISWGGNARIAAKDDKVSYFRVRHQGGTLIQKYTVEDEDDDNTTSNDVPIDGETILFLNAGSTYNMLIDAYKKGSAVQNTSAAMAGMWLKAEELLTF